MTNQLNIEVAQWGDVWVAIVRAHGVSAIGSTRKDAVDGVLRAVESGEMAPDEGVDGMELGNKDNWYAGQA